MWVNMSLRPKKSIALAVEAKEFFHVGKGVWRVINVFSANRAGFLGQTNGGKTSRLWIFKAREYP
jgi:hypothetical protein